MKERFKELYDDHSDRIYQYILLLVKNRETAEDLTQETFLKVYRNLSSFRDEASTYTWTARIARNLTYDYLRRKKIISLLPFGSHEAATEPLEAIIITNETAAALYKGIDSLPPKYKEIIILRKIQEFSIKETAAILNCSEGKVKVTASRALNHLKKALAERSGLYEKVQ